MRLRAVFVGHNAPLSFSTQPTELWGYKVKNGGQLQTRPQTEYKQESHSPAGRPTEPASGAVTLPPSSRPNLRGKEIDCGQHLQMRTVDGIREELRFMSEAGVWRVHRAKL